MKFSIFNWRISEDGFTPAPNLVRGFTSTPNKVMVRGFTILEILISILVVTIGIVGIYYLVATVFIAATVNSDKFLASQLGQEGLELARNLRDQNWLQENDWNVGLIDCADPSVGCEWEIDYNDSALSAFQDRYLKLDDEGFYNYDTGDDSGFKRKIIITEQPQFLNVRVEITWVGAKALSTQENRYEVEENLYDWR